ncbi:hypothetical protein SESBI_33242 [Sesbania bispinosa]|nr:hypothetical protein SESBI_33242 [Sesbania bispinosa]
MGFLLYREKRVEDTKTRGSGTLNCTRPEETRESTSTFLVNIWAIGARFHVATALLVELPRVRL